VDFTIADFVADERAPTPSGAAERAVPDGAEWLRGLSTTSRRLVLAMRRRLQDQRLALATREQRLARVHPGVTLRQRAQRLDELEGRLQLAARASLARVGSRLAAADALLRRSSPALRVMALRLRLETGRRALAAAVRSTLTGARQRFELAARALHAVSPLATLERGYAIVTDAAGHVLQDAAATAPGARITARLARGRIEARVEQIRADGDEPGAATE